MKKWVFEIFSSIVNLEAHGADDLNEDGDVEDQESDEERGGALGVMESRAE